MTGEAVLKTLYRAKESRQNTEEGDSSVLSRVTGNVSEMMVTHQSRESYHVSDQRLKEFEPK